MKKLFFFGCIDSVGHYWTPRNGERPAELPKALYDGIDGKYVPKHKTEQGSGNYTRLDNIHIVSWHDYTIDKRGGSNSNIIGVGYSDHSVLAVQNMWDDLKQQFPRIYTRQNAPIFIHNMGLILNNK